MHTHLVFLQLLVTKDSLLVAHAADCSLESTSGSLVAPVHKMSEQTFLPWLSPAHPSSRSLQAC